MKKDTNKKIIIGFSIGDYNGIGPEILLKSFSDFKLLNKFIPVIFCDKHILEFYSKRYGHEFKIKETNNLDSIADENSVYTFLQRKVFYRINSWYFVLKANSNRCDTLCEE